MNKRASRVGTQHLILWLIVLYQRTLSLDHGWLRLLHIRCCKFTPSCSEYTRLAVLKYGTMQGLRKGFLRFLRCNPFGEGGVEFP